MTDQSTGTPAPAEATLRAPWPLWKKIVAYVALAALATVSIWVIDLKVTPQAPSHISGR